MDSGFPAARRPAWWTGAIRPDIGLQRRIMLYVAVGSIAAVIFFGYVAQRSLETSTGIIYSERLQLARLVAYEVAAAVEPAVAGSSLRLQSPERIKEVLVLHSMAAMEERPLFHISLVDHAGDILLESHPTPGQQSNEEHKALLHNLMVGRRSGVVIHRPAAAPDKTHMVAYVPLPGLPGGVTLEQMQDVALAVPRAHRRHLTVAGLVFTMAGVGLAWFTTRQVAGPLTQLTAVTRKIAAGDLSTPIPQGGRDEVRDLAASFETMRRQLRDSHADLERVNRELERRVQERTRELQQRHSELTLATNRLLQREAERTFLLQKTIQAQEDERRRVARELHDTVAQFLSLIVIRLSLLETQAQGCPPHLAAGLDDLRARTSQAVDEVRRLIVDLRPELLDDLGLAAALGYYAEQMLGRNGIAVRLAVNVGDRRLPALVELVVFRVMQEAITNIFKHAHARQARIALDYNDGTLEGTVADDGVGFDPARSSQVTGEAGVGLLGMRERVALLGGTLHIQSAPGRGTRVVFRVAVEEEVQHEANPHRAG